MRWSLGQVLLISSLTGQVISHSYIKNTNCSGNTTCGLATKPYYSSIGKGNYANINVDNNFSELCIADPNASPFSVLQEGDLGHAYPGESITILWPADNHAHTFWPEQGPYGPITIYMSKDEKVDVSIFKTQALATMSFDTCFHAPYQSLTGDWAKDEVICTANFTFPEDARGLYTFVWAWNIYEQPTPGFATCFQYSIEPPGSENTAKTWEAAGGSSDYANIPAINPPRLSDDITWDAYYSTATDLDWLKAPIHAIVTPDPDSNSPVTPVSTPAIPTPSTKVQSVDSIQVAALLAAFVTNTVENKPSNPPLNPPATQSATRVTTPPASVAQSTSIVLSTSVVLVTSIVAKTSNSSTITALANAGKINTSIQSNVGNYNSPSLFSYILVLISLSFSYIIQ